MTQNTNYRNPSNIDIIVNGFICMLCMSQRMDLLMGQALGGGDLVLTCDGGLLQGAPFNVDITKQHIALTT